LAKTGENGAFGHLDFDRDVNLEGLVSAGTGSAGSGGYVCSVAREAEKAIPGGAACEGQGQIHPCGDPQYAGAGHRCLQHEVQAAAEFGTLHHFGTHPSQ